MSRLKCLLDSVYALGSGFTSMGPSLHQRLRVHQLIETCDSIEGLRALCRYLVEREIWVRTTFGEQILKGAPDPRSDQKSSL